MKNLVCGVKLLMTNLFFAGNLFALSSVDYVMVETEAKNFLSYSQIEGRQVEAGGAWRCVLDTDVYGTVSSLFTAKGDIFLYQLNTEIFITSRDSHATPTRIHEVIGNNGHRESMYVAVQKRNQETGEYTFGGVNISFDSQSNISAVKFEALMWDKNLNTSAKIVKGSNARNCTIAQKPKFVLATDYYTGVQFLYRSAYDRAMAGLNIL